MLLLGALFALFLAGIWLYCLVDVALTPGDKCPGLPKAAWIALVGGTFIIGAAMWLAVRRPARSAAPFTAARAPGRATTRQAGPGGKVTPRPSDAGRPARGTLRSSWGSASQPGDTIAVGVSPGPRRSAGR
jgi:hypothetical protein